MDFRWVAFITLWTFLVGPIWAAPPRHHAGEGKTSVVSQRPAPAPHARR